MKQLNIPLWMEILYNIDGKRKVDLSRQLKITYSHICHVCDMLEDKKLIIRQKTRGLSVYYTLTQKGNKIMIGISNIYTKI